jgi:hypothetical protein
MAEIEIRILSRWVLKKGERGEQMLLQETAVREAHRKRWQERITWRFRKEDARRAPKYGRHN